MYKDTWESCIGEELVCKRERHNVYDPFTVTVKAAHAITSERNNMNKNHVLALIFANALKFAKFTKLKDS